MRAKYLLDAVATLREAVKALDNAGECALATKCHGAAHALEFMSGIAEIDIKVEQPLDYVREQFERESA